MQAMYKYSLFKYVKSWSTWIILALTVLIVTMIAGYLPTHFISKVKHNPQIYARLSLIIVSSTTTFVAIFTSVFAGFKSATMYRDEIEDGSLLVMLSKPLTRRKILLSKWLALQTTIAAYTLITAIAFMVTIEAADIGKNIDLSIVGTSSLASKAIAISLLMWLVLEVLAVIFSSIGLLVSSKFSIGVSAGICIGIGVVIPVTSIIGTFASKTAYEDVSTNHSEAKQVIETGVLPNLTEKDIPASAIDVYKNLPDLKINTPYKIGVETGEKDSFKWMQVFDINYQVQKLSEFASEQAIDQDKRNSLSMGEAVAHIYKQPGTVKKSDDFDGTKAQQISLFNKMILDSWDKTHDYRDILLVKAFEAIVDYNWNKDYKLDYLVFKDMLGIDVLNNQTKHVFDIKDLYPWIFKRTPITDAIRSKYTPEQLKFYTDLFATNDEATEEEKKEFNFTWEYSKIIDSVANFAWKFASTDEESSVHYVYSDWGTPSAKYTQLFAVVAQIMQPVDFWIDSSYFRKYRIKTGYSFDQQATQSDNYFGEIMGTGFLEGAILQSRWDAIGYFEVTSAINSGHNLALIKRVEYSNKYTILLIYLAIGFILLPATYLVIRKQDFR